MINILRFARLAPDAKLPTRSHITDAGWDLYAHLIGDQGRAVKRMLPPNTTRPIHTGIIAMPPDGFYLQVASRSGLAMHSVFVANAPGIVDPGYTGEIIILLHNSGLQTHWVQHEDRIAQLVLAPMVSANSVEIEIDKLPTTDRGARGFGSTGK